MFQPSQQTLVGIYTCLVLTYILFVAAMIFTGCEPARATNREGVRFSQDSFNCGSIHSGEKKQYRLEVLNNLDTPIKLLGFSTSCKCTLVKTNPVWVNGNSSVSVDVQISADSAESGQVYRSVALRTSEAFQPIKIAVLTFKVLLTK